MSNLDVINDVTIAVTWDEIKTNLPVILISTYFPAKFFTFDHSTSIYGLKLSVLRGAGGKAHATDPVPC